MAALPEDSRNNARNLRKHQPDAEELLWRILRGRRFAGRKFRRQHGVGRFILDFYCAELKLAVELDGGQHNETAMRQRDAERSRWLGECGIRVLRFWNNEVLQDTESVLEVLWRECAREGEGIVQE